MAMHIAVIDHNLSVPARSKAFHPAWSPAASKMIRVIIGGLISSIGNAFRRPALPLARREEFMGQGHYQSG
jgi:hypothetical protein